MMHRAHCDSRRGRTAGQRGMALVSSMLLLLIVTILVVSMFRSFTTQEKIAGNVREKERALHAAESAEQYAEWWLTFGNNLQTGAVTCGAPQLNANNAGEGQICSNTLAPRVGAPTPNLGIDVTQVPWTIAGPGGGLVGVTFLPGPVGTSPGMTIGAGGTSSNPLYFAKPVFYIADVGVAADGQGEAYQIDAVGWGGSANAVAVVESTYEVAKGVQNLGGL
jgi:type IV pilus assembly protein PilX